MTMIDRTRHFRTAVLLASLTTSCLALASCATPASGPSSAQIVKIGNGASSDAQGIKIVDVTDATVERVTALHNRGSLREKLGDVAPFNTVVGNGDTLDVTIWEAPPAALFGVMSAGSSAVGLAGRSPDIPDQMVDSNGQISIPFVGKVTAVDRTPTQIASEIERRLRGVAHLPQVVVRRIDNSTANVTIVGDVADSKRMPLTPKGERLLDALASAGGTKQPIGKLMVQVTRGSHVASMPLERVIQDPLQNIRLAPDDVVTLLYQPYSFTALGAVGANAEVPFEGTGMTLAQALGRVGGLKDERSDPKGVFIFRMENRLAVDDGATISTPNAASETVPVIYRVNLKDPASFFLAQRFEIRNRDVIYISNSPTADLQKFLGLLSQATFSLTGIGNAVD